MNSVILIADSLIRHAPFAIVLLLQNYDLILGKCFDWIGHITSQDPLSWWLMTIPVYCSIPPQSALIYWFDSICCCYYRGNSQSQKGHEGSSGGQWIYLVQGCNDNNNNHSRKPIRQQLVLSLTRYHNIKVIHSFVRIECFNTDNKIMELITHFR